MDKLVTGSHHDHMTTDKDEALERLLRQPTVSVPQVAQLLGLGRSTVYAAVQSGQIPAIRIGHRVRIPSRWIRNAIQMDPPVDDNTA
ncbi:helix-turn-helix domain-containing protein [Nocardia nova]|uniref:Helix-turn-helix domain-containing protein n=1 Tax=Nocardia nova TaxID=37330 RepID=A0A2S6A059_9NOCA|nr:helix-turn-helix domain-containing protein [Nocardia nova]PPI89110.1 hypothetical protein C5E46_35290 [Nocardia nova]PPJ24340.1 hypothetical protein C5F51_26565 [Nocardia nova]